MDGRDQGFGLRREAPEFQMTSSTEWQPSHNLSRKPVAPKTPTTPAPTNNPHGAHTRSLSTPSVTSPPPSFSERTGAAAYFPAPIVGDHDKHTRPRPAPLRLDSYEYSSYTPSQSSLSTPYTGGGLPGKHHMRVDSRSALLSSSPPPPLLPPMDRQQSYTHHPPRYIELYNRYWHPSWNMYFFLFAGIAFALGHHFFYQGLDGTLANNQSRMLRYGAALSFLSKASLGTAVILAFRQRVWMTVRRKVLTLAAVDSLFAAAEDMSAIFNFEVFRQARIAMVLALYVWCTPLVVILASDTLAVQPGTTHENTTCPSIRTLNFSHEETNDFRIGQRINNLFELSVSLWNTTSENTSAPEFFDYWISPSIQFDEVATSAVFQKKPLARTNASAEICGTGWNCTFTINFTGPGYKCTELASGVGATPKDLRGASVPFPMDMLAPRGNHTYIAHASLGDYANPQMNNTGSGGIPLSGPPFPRHLGALRTEPVLWFGYAHVDDPSVPQPDNSSAPGWDTAFTPKVFGCEHYETEYVVDFDYTSTVQRTKVRSRKFLAPVIDTRFLPGVDANDGTLDNTTAVPESNYVLPTDVHRYRRLMAYHSIGSRLRYFVNGTIQEPYKDANTKAIQTRLIDQHTYLGVNRLMEQVQSLYEDIILSMFSNPRFLAVSWATDPSQVTGTNLGAEHAYRCQRSRTDNRYRYRVADLWTVYAVAIGLAVVGVAFGVAAVREEGLVRNTRFSSIVAATRGPGLEKLPWGNNAVPGCDRRPVAGARVGYGLVPSDFHAGGGAETYGFGLEGDVKQHRNDPSRAPTGLGSPFSRASNFKRWSRLSQQQLPQQP